MCVGFKLDASDTTCTLAIEGRQEISPFSSPFLTGIIPRGLGKGKLGSGELVIRLAAEHQPPHRSHVLISMRNSPEMCFSTSDRLLQPSKLSPAGSSEEEIR